MYLSYWPIGNGGIPARYISFYIGSLNTVSLEVAPNTPRSYTSAISYHGTLDDPMEIIPWMHRVCTSFLRVHVFFTKWILKSSCFHLHSLISGWLLHNWSHARISICEVAFVVSSFCSIYELAHVGTSALLTFTSHCLFDMSCFRIYWHGYMKLIWAFKLTALCIPKRHV